MPIMGVAVAVGGGGVLAWLGLLQLWCRYSMTLVKTMVLWNHWCYSGFNKLYKGPCIPPLDSAAYTCMLISYRRLSPLFQFSLPGVTLVYLSQWSHLTLYFMLCQYLILYLFLYLYTGVGVYRAYSPINTWKKICIFIVLRWNSWRKSRQKS